MNIQLHLQKIKATVNPCAQLKKNWKSQKSETGNPKMSPSINKRWFQDQFISRGITQRKVARALKTNPSAISMILRGTRKMKLAEATALASLLVVPLEEILIHAGINTQGSESKEMLPIAGWVDEHFTVHLEAIKGGGPSAKAPAPQGATKKDLKVIRYHTAGTALDAFDGCLIYYRPWIPKGGVPADALGKLCVVQMGDGDALLAVVKRGYLNGRFNLLSQSGAVIKRDAELKNASPVVWQKM